MRSYDRHGLWDGPQDRFTRPADIVLLGWPTEPLYAPARRGPDVRQVLGWVAIGRIVVAALLAVAMTAVALRLAALALTVLAVILRGLWGDLNGRKRSASQAIRRAGDSTERDMGTEKQRLAEEFLDLAARLEGLHHLKPKNVVDPSRLKRWQKQHGKEADKILAHRAVLAKEPTIVSKDDLRQWIEKARAALTAI